MVDRNEINEITQAWAVGDENWTAAAAAAAPSEYRAEHSSRGKNCMMQGATVNIVMHLQIYKLQKYCACCYVKMTQSRTRTWTRQLLEYFPFT